jgi:energy-coupling factor transporter ATP-binding protein EcfA2
MHIIRRTYRDVQKHACSHHPNIYRQIAAGAGVVAITDHRATPLPSGYEILGKIPVIRHIMLYPPLVINPPMNKRTGSFDPIDTNPVPLAHINPDEWLCYPALVGKLLVNIYFHETFYELGFTLANLFELADDKALAGRKPDAVFLFGVPGDSLDQFGKCPTVFFNDTANKLLVGAVPNRKEFGYFGYLKKMALTLHNICIMQQGRLPYHGALFRILLKGGKSATVLVMGDTGAGKSETLEAFRVLGRDEIQDIIVIADDMGSLDIAADGRVLGFGTEIGAFVRLDDLSPGYAFGQLDRIVMMNAGQTNARIVVPVTIYKHVVLGYPVDIILYCNNFEDIDDDHPVLERFPDADTALPVFRKGASMSKGTTTSTGLTTSYFANVFGPEQHQTEHEKIATRYFKHFIKSGLFVGQMRTRLAIPGWEQKGPEASARALLQVIKER